MTSLRPLTSMWERLILRWALRQLCPTHPLVPWLTLRLQLGKSIPSPLHPHDSIVTGACVIASLALLGMVLLGWVK